MKLSTAVGILCLLLLKLLVGSGGYSGYSVPPDYGDFEAHRHWMEITTNLHVSQWYVNSTDNDLAYWGIDYPPLSAYHSYLMGKIAKYINPNWTALYTSRGYESVELKMFMRYSVIFVDFLILVSAVFYFSTKNNVLMFFPLLYPGLLLIDHGHFQYNCVALGFLFWAICFIEERNIYLGAIFYVLSIFFKQTSLYFSVSIFFKILSLCFEDGLFRGIMKAIKVGICCLIVILVILFPFIIPNPSFASLLCIYKRVFPFWRGLYEDKVANFWCSLSVVVKPEKILKNYLLHTCAGFTLVFSILPCLVHFKNSRLFTEILTASSLAFYLFSFHVHEKSIIFPALVFSLSTSSYWLVLWFLEISTIRLFFS